MRRAVLIAAGALLALPPLAKATTLEEAIAAARAYNPDLRAARAQTDAANARLDAAKGARLPTVGLAGEYMSGRNDLGGFFGFAAADVDPRAVRLEVAQPLYSGGAILAGVDKARAGQAGAKAQLVQADDALQVAVARAYVGVRTAQAFFEASQAHAKAFDEWARQAQLRFAAGEIPRSDLDLTLARSAEARAGTARAQGALEVARARYVALVGDAPIALEPIADDGVLPPLDETLARAEAVSPTLEAAEAAVRAAQAAARLASAQGLPSVSIAARAEQARDQFFPGYRSDAVTVGLQGRWTLFAGGRVQAAKVEASAEVRAAEARREATRAALKTAVIAAWSDLQASRLATVAARDQAQAAKRAVESLRQEVRVGQRPVVDLLDAERDQLGAVARALAAEGEVTVSGRQLQILAAAGAARP
ncbi:TolC family type I secretion outer membrane protein [Caulobacter sp. BE264]|uniref:TolC family outer membrane protein n=1 Tax=Caulobacter sp. BE264 TaxID=2817724 RepID=UPI0028544580|nr:TolC family outer membrane protein [Caulobacter sp. BE264]MDR7229912.1 TolC family type I secretion outer membrane protein [Caulobacter sp. BE264]